MLEIKLDNAITELKKIKSKKVFLQIPEGLKVKVEEIASKLKENDFEIVTGMDPCFGACDIKASEAKKLGCDTILHLGHTQFSQIKEIPTIYAPLNYTLENFNELMKKLVDFLTEQKITEIGLTTTAQFLDYIPKIKKILEKEKVILKTQKGIRVNDGQVLGCNYSAVPDTEKIVYFGDGLFHPLGIHFATQKEVIICNPFTTKISLLDKEKDKFLRERILLIEKAKEANSFAILVSTKTGQERIQFAEKISAELIEKGKSANIYAMDFISEEKLLGMNVGAYISTACPRLAIDDYKSYKKPIINASEVKYFWEGYDNYKLELYY